MGTINQLHAELHERKSFLLLFNHNITVSIRLTMMLFVKFAVIYSKRHVILVPRGHGKRKRHRRETKLTH